MLEVEQFDDLEQVQQIAVMILRKYIKEFYSDRQSSWEQSQLSYVPMDEELTREQGTSSRSTPYQSKRAPRAS